MAQDFSEAIRQITSIRQQKKGFSTEISNERENIKRNQYLLDAALNHSQDGKVYQTNILNSRRNLSSLAVKFQDAIKSELTSLTDLSRSFGGYNNLVNQLNDRYPILFFPARIETTFYHSGSSYELWVRIFPDEIAVDTHEEGLTQDEIDQGQQYWKTFAGTTDPIVIGQAWDLVCRSYGPERAAWVTLQNKPSNIGQIPTPAPDDLVFPDLTPPKADSWTKQPVSKIMPDAFMIYAYDTTGTVLTKQTNNIPDELKIGFDPSLETGDPNSPPSFDQDANNDLVANEEVKWMIDFDAAIAKGMGAKITITQAQYNNGFKKILVLGVKSTLTPEDSKTRLEELIANHHYTDGFSLLKQGTGTNNTDDAYSGYSSVDFANTTTYLTERDRDLFTPIYVQRQKKDGQLLCEALGIDYDLLYHVFHSDGTDINDSMNMNTVLFQASVGYFVNEMLAPHTIRGDNNTQLRDFFIDYVRSRGALPSIRSGVQPYGILPASVYSRIDWGSDPNAGLYRNIFNVTSALDSQWTAVLASAEANSQNLANGSLSDTPASQKLSDILSQGPVSDAYIQRVGAGSGYIWNNLSYAGLKYPEQQRQWLSNQKGLMQKLIKETGLGLKLDSRILQLNYLEKQSSVTIPVVADENTPKDAPLPRLGRVVVF